MLAAGNVEGILGVPPKEMIGLETFSTNRVPSEDLFSVITLYNQYVKFTANNAIDLNLNLFVVNFPYYKENKAIARVLTQMKPLVVTDSIAELLIIFGREIGHLVKNDNYWMRLEQGGTTFCYNTNLRQRNHKDILTPKEKEIVRLMFNDLDYDSISENLNISRSTVIKHVKNAIKKTGAKDSTALLHLCNLVKLFD